MGAGPLVAPLRCKGGSLFREMQLFLEELISFLVMEQWKPHYPPLSGPHKILGSLRMFPSQEF